jgi:hypothetical protein
MKKGFDIFMKQIWWQQVLIIVMVSIIYVQIFGVIGTKVLVPLVGWSGGTQPAGEKADSFEGRFVRYDSGYYLRIARDGYRVDGTEKAFFPLYPLLTRLVNNILGLSFMWSGSFVSIFCFIVACLFLYQWVVIDYKTEVAIWSTIWVCAFPMAFFFSAVYAEALFFLASVASIYFARRGQFVASGIIIALAGATRPPAFLLAIPYVIEFLLQRNYGKIPLLKFIVGGMIAPLGMLGYLTFLGLQAGSFDLLNIYTSNHSAEWKRITTWPWVTFYNGLRAVLFGTGITPDWFSRALVLQDFVYAVLGLILSIWSLFNLRLSTSSFLLVGMLFFYTNHGPYGYAFWSVPRYVATLFPFYLILALFTLRLPNKYRWLPVMCSIGLLGILSAWFASGRWVA